MKLDPLNTEQRLRLMESLLAAVFPSEAVTPSAVAATFEKLVAAVEGRNGADAG